MREKYNVNKLEQNQAIEKRPHLETGTDYIILKRHHMYARGGSHGRGEKKVRGVTTGSRVQVHREPCRRSRSRDSEPARLGLGRMENYWRKKYTGSKRVKKIRNMG